MKVKGLEGMTTEQLMVELQQGGKFVVYSYVISVLILTFRRSSDIHYIRPGQSPASEGMNYTLISLFCGWWGFPFGFIFTPIAIVKNLSGGKDVTREVAAMLYSATPATASTVPAGPPPA